MKTVTALALAAAASVAFASPAVADEDRFSVTPYIWLPTVEGDLRFTIPPQDPDGPEFFPNVRVGPNDYLENLEGVFMIAAEARFEPVSVFTDFIYLDFSRDAARLLSIDRVTPIPPIDIGSTSELSGSLWTLAGGYDLIDNEDWRLQAFAGFRYLDVDADVEWRLSGPLGLFPETGSVSSSSESWDGLVGVRGEARLGDWFVPYYVDVGGGDSDLTWQGIVGIGYRWGWGDLRLDYRYLSYEQGEENLVRELTLGGPAVGASFRF
ncbi:MAG: hypothetical protein ACREH4_13070 [Vitreimonas sp.]